MGHNPHVHAALAAEFDDDRKVYETLSPAERRLADNHARRLFAATSALNNVGYWGLQTGNTGLVKLGKAAEWAMVGVGETLYWALYGPYIGAAYLLQGTGWLLKEAATRTITGPLKAAGFTLGLFGKKSARERLLQMAGNVRRTAERYWKNTKEFFGGALEKLGKGARWFSRNVMYRPLVWFFDPRVNGKPLFGSEKANRVWSYGAAGLVLIGSGGGLLALKGFLFGLHAYAGTSLLMHAGISLIAKASTFVVLPVIAASKRGLKNIPAFKAMAYRYQLRVAHANKIHARYESKNSIQPLTFAPRKIQAFFQHIKDETVPAFYEHGHKTGPAAPPMGGETGKGAEQPAAAAGATTESRQPARQPVFKSAPKRKDEPRSVVRCQGSFEKAVAGFGATTIRSITQTLPARLRSIAVLNRPKSQANA